MVEHLVLYKLRDGVSDQEVTNVGDRLRSLVGRIDGVLSVHFGRDSSRLGLSGGYDLGLHVSLTDEVARDRYLDHPEHVALIPKVEAITTALLVLDITDATKEAK